MSRDNVGAAVLAGSVGDLFTHRIAEWYGCESPEVILQYIGRSSPGRADCSTALCGGCGNGPHVSPEGRLNFRQVCDNHRGLTTHFGAFNGGLRDALGRNGAWPICDYFDYDTEGNFDERVISIPVEMCGAMMKYDDDDNDDDFGDVDEEEKAEP